MPTCLELFEKAINAAVELRCTDLLVDWFRKRIASLPETTQQKYIAEMKKLLGY